MQRQSCLWVALAKNVITRAASARRVVFVALEEKPGFFCLDVSPGSSSGTLLCGADMAVDGNDKRHRKSGMKYVTAMFPRLSPNSDGKLTYTGGSQ